jgi:AraC-like DNA-binding protein
MKKPLFQKISLDENVSFNLLKIHRPYFKVPWHFHPEVEIMLIVKGEGTRFVGDSIGNFEPGDLVMVGANLSHVWKNADLHYQNNPDVIAEARVILFREDCFGKDFFQIKEMNPVYELLKRAEHGILFKGETALKLADNILLACDELLPHKKMISFISILHQLAEATDYKLLCSTGYLQQGRNSDLERLNQVLDYIMQHYRDAITLEEAAKIAHMTVPAFCRYFKSRTNKTFIEFINELRIGYSHRRLIETQNTINQICFESGYGQLSNFYKQFQLFTGTTPSKYRKTHEKKEM